MQTNKTDDQKMIESLKFGIEMAMRYGGQFEDCLTPAQAIDLVKSQEEDSSKKGARFVGRPLPLAA